jgi:hypothetical protein
VEELEWGDEQQVGEQLAARVVVTGGSTTARRRDLEAVVLMVFF